MKKFLLTLTEKNKTGLLNVCHESRKTKRLTADPHDGKQVASWLEGGLSVEKVTLTGRLQNARWERKALISINKYPVIFCLTLLINVSSENQNPSLVKIFSFAPPAKTSESKIFSSPGCRMTNGSLSLRVFVSIGKMHAGSSAEDFTKPNGSISCEVLVK